MEPGATMRIAKTLAILAIGWLIGVGTTAVAPELVSQRRTALPPEARRLISDGWYVVRTDLEGAFVTLERRRFRLPD
jgi:hypothetical protein